MVASLVLKQTLWTVSTLVISHLSYTLIIYEKNNGKLILLFFVFYLQFNSNFCYQQVKFFVVSVNQSVPHTSFF